MIQQKQGNYGKVKVIWEQIQNFKGNATVIFVESEPA